MVSATERETFAFRSAFQILMWQTFQITDSLAIVASKEYIRRGEGMYYLVWRSKNTSTGNAFNSVFTLITSTKK